MNPHQNLTEDLEAFVLHNTDAPVGSEENNDEFNQNMSGDFDSTPPATPVTPNETETTIPTEPVITETNDAS